MPSPLQYFPGMWHNWKEYKQIVHKMQVRTYTHFRNVVFKICCMLFLKSYLLCRNVGLDQTSPFFSFRLVFFLFKELIAWHLSTLNASVGRFGLNPFKSIYCSRELMVVRSELFLGHGYQVFYPYQITRVCQFVGYFLRYQFEINPYCITCTYDMTQRLAWGCSCLDKENTVFLVFEKNANYIKSKRPNKFLTVRFPRPAPRHSWKEGCDQSFLFFVRSVLCLLPLLPCLVLLDPGGRVSKTLHQSQ